MIAPGAECRLLGDRLGCIASPGASRFEDEIAYAGQVATYFGKHPTVDGWHLLIAVGQLPTRTRSRAARCSCPAPRLTSRWPRDDGF
jgi:hypothetical protein